MPLDAPLDTPLDQQDQSPGSGIPDSTLAAGTLNVYTVSFVGDGLTGGGDSPALFRRLGDVEALTLTVTAPTVFAVAAAGFSAVDLYTREEVAGVVAGAVFVDTGSSAVSHSVQVLVDLTGLASAQDLLILSSLSVAGPTDGDTQTLCDSLRVFVSP